MEVSDRLYQFNSVQFPVLVQVVHVEIVELELLGCHVSRWIDLSIQMFFDVTEMASN